MVVEEGGVAGSQGSGGSRGRREWEAKMVVMVVGDDGVSWGFIVWVVGGVRVGVCWGVM